MTPNYLNWIMFSRPNTDDHNYLRVVIYINICLMTMCFSLRKDIFNFKNICYLKYLKNLLIVIFQQRLWTPLILPYPQPSNRFLLDTLITRTIQIQSLIYYPYSQILWNLTTINLSRTPFSIRSYSFNCEHYN